MISINKVTVRFGGFSLFEEIAFVVSSRDRIALTGKNGAGKSTLLKLIAGLETPSEGTIDKPKDLRIGYLPQVMKHEDGHTVYEECEAIFEHIRALKQEVDDLANALAERTDYDSEEYTELIDRYSSRSDELSMVSDGSYHAQIERTLMGLGFECEDFARQCSTFSGGWRMRIELAKILLQRPDVLLLDEPTNHLDIESIRWLERFINQSNSALILISHDRAFMDATTKRTIEIELGKIYDYRTNYSHYVKLREERLEQQQRAYLNQQKSIQATEAFIERFRYKPSKSDQVQSRIKQLEKIERIEIEDIDRKAMHFRFMPAVQSGAYPVVVEHLEKKYGNHMVFSDVNMTIKRGEKVAFVGKNGAGKSTLVKCIMGDINDYSGTLQLGHQVEVSYFAQTQSQALDDNLTIYETIDREAQGEIRTRINDLLGAFMFGGELSEKKVGVLSGGERGRLALIKLLLRPANLLILDEPTNHLDIRSKEVLKEAIANFEGTVILVSHDREFLDGLATRLYEFKSGRVIEHMGGIYDWLHKKDVEEEQANPRATVAQNQMSTVNKEGAENYAQHKEESKRRRALERELKACEERSEEIDGLLRELEVQISENPQDEHFKRYDELKREQDSIMTRWEEIAEELEA